MKTSASNRIINIIAATLFILLLAHKSASDRGQAGWPQKEKKHRHASFHQLSMKIQFPDYSNPITSGKSSYANTKKIFQATKDK